MDNPRITTTNIGVPFSVTIGQYGTLSHLAVVDIKCIFNIYNNDLNLGFGKVTEGLETIAEKRKAIDPLKKDSDTIIIEGQYQFKIKFEHFLAFNRLKFAISHGKLTSIAFSDDKNFYCDSDFTSVRFYPE